MDSTAKDTAARFVDILERVRREKPVVHHLTNWVTIYDCAQIVKTLGASPVMAHSPDEVQDMTKIASALVLNIGTLTAEFIEAMIRAGKQANSRKIPIVLDVCGAGATPFRDAMSLKILDSVQVDIIKGNATEIARVAGENVRTKGVDSGLVDIDLIALASTLAKKRNAVIVITGKDDIIADSSRFSIVSNGHEMLTSIVGSGCMAASVIGTFAAVEKDLVTAAAAALACFAIAAELASIPTSGPGSFKEQLYDMVYNLDSYSLEENLRVLWSSAMRS